LKDKWLTALKARVATTVRDGTDLEIPWYGGTTRRVRVSSEYGLWSTQGEPPVAIRWVLGVDPTDQDPPLALFNADLDLATEQIVA
jgi:hypothetical protein